MIRIVIMGICGQMGHALYHAAKESSEFTVAAGVDRLADAAFACPIYPSLEKVAEAYDVVIDFSVPAALEAELCTARKLKKPVVVCTTGLTEAHQALLQEAAQDTAIFQSGNMSVGVNLQMQLLRQASAALGAGFDVGIVERHHRKKVDAPSDSAHSLANAVNSQREEALEHKYGRSERNRRRPDNEIGFHSVRGGTIVGEHEVSFIGTDEIIEITHKAFSKRVFAEGALRAAAFLTGKENGFYNMENVLAESETAEETEKEAITAQAAVLLTIETPAAETALLAEAAEALSEAEIPTDLLSYLPLADERTALGMALQASDLGNALEALQPLQVAHETLDVQVQGGITKLCFACKANAANILPKLAAKGVNPMLFAADAGRIALCIKNSDRAAAAEVLETLL